MSEDSINNLLKMALIPETIHHNQTNTIQQNSEVSQERNETNRKKESQSDTTSQESRQTDGENMTMTSWTPNPETHNNNLSPLDNQKDTSNQLIMTNKKGSQEKEEASTTNNESTNSLKYPQHIDKILGHFYKNLKARFRCEHKDYSFIAILGADEFKDNHTVLKSYLSSLGSKALNTLVKRHPELLTHLKK